MKIVAQRVLRAALFTDDTPVSEIGCGLVVYFGVGAGDTEAQAKRCAEKIAKLRLFRDGADKINLSVSDVGGEVLFVSQFTLYGDCTRGNRPSFTAAERPARAEELYRYAGRALEECGVRVKWGVFGADMRIEQVCDGPVTVICDF